MRTESTRCVLLVGIIDIVSDIERIIHENLHDKDSCAQAGHPISWRKDRRNRGMWGSDGTEPLRHNDRLPTSDPIRFGWTKRNQDQWCLVQDFRVENYFFFKKKFSWGGPVTVGILTEKTHWKHCVLPATPDRVSSSPRMRTAPQRQVTGTSKAPSAQQCYGYNEAKVTNSYKWLYRSRTSKSWIILQSWPPLLTPSFF